VLTGAKQSVQFEQLLLGPAGAEVPVHVELAMTRDAAGQPCGASMFFLDLEGLRRRSRSRHRQDAYVDSLCRLAGDVVVVGSATGEFVYVSPAAERVLGYTQEQLTGATGGDLVHPDDVAVAESAYFGVVADGGSCTFRLRIRHGDGTWRWVEETVSNQLMEPVGGIVCNLRDVHDEVLAAESLRESEIRFRTIAETANEGMWLVTPHGQTLFANAQMAAILGVPLSQLYSDPATSLLDSEAAATIAERLVTRAERGAEQYEIDLVRRSGERLRLAISATPQLGPDGAVVGSLAMVDDITQAQRVEHELRRAALHDALTGLPNRALFLDRLEQALTRGEGRTAVVFLDLDRFKLVNDHRGHDVGDQLLVAVAERLSTSLRKQDTVARFGGDEFVVLSEDVDEETALQIGQQLLDALAKPLTVDGVVVHVDASIGLALSPPSSAVDLIRFADTALYAAKAAGRGRIRLFDPALAEAAEQRFVLADRLRTALATDGLSMHYQPIVDLTSGKVLGIEALARWTDPDHGSVSPDRFVDIAETSGLAPLLDRWAIERALRDARALRRTGAIPYDAYVSVNLSASNVSDRGLEAFIVATTAASGLKPADVMLEITEGAIMTDPDAGIPLLRRLRARGFLLALDDFGTGQSSLAYLRDLPINHLKIDRSFIAGIREDTDALAVAASIVDLGRAVGMTVIAEGVEQSQQESLLRELGCHAAQGWLWSRALPVAEIVADRPWVAGYDVGAQEAPSEPRRRRGRPQVQAQHGLDRILAMHRKGASLSTIAAALNSDGYLTPAGLRWHQSSVARAVSDAAYPALRPGSTAQGTAR
jgi:diguanylate cyclase (GGDEF)-like protein/PAS domain S-box-containing protein